MADDMEETVDKVCEFLQKRDVDPEVIEKFRHEKMDFSAVKEASDDCLKTLGLTRAGDRLSLLAFCRRNQSNRKELLKAFLSGKAPKTSATATKVSFSKEKKEKLRKIQLGWLHYSQKKQKYQCIRLNKGGGSREVYLSMSSTKKDILSIAKGLFFPYGKSSIGNEDDMVLELGNFQGQCIEDVINDGKDEFTLGHYIESSKAHRVQLYLRSHEKEREVIEVKENSDSEDDEDLMYSPFGKAAGRKEPQQHKLIGSSKERQALAGSIDKAYQESLEVDRKKQSESQGVEKTKEEKEEEEEEAKKQAEELQKKNEAIRKAREERVPIEPVAKSDSTVTVKVTHPTLGRIMRLFSGEDSVMSVYDWVGSLSSEPPYFGLYLPFSNRCRLLPTTSVKVCDKSTLMMQACEEGISLCDDDWEVQFKGFGDEDPHVAIPSFDIELPDILMVGDTPNNDRSSADEAEASTSGTADQNQTSSRDPGRLFRMMTNQLQQARERMEVYVADGLPVVNLSRCISGRTKIVVRRCDIFKYMLELYQSDEVCSTELEVTFEGEEGADIGGLTRDLFSCFWERAYEEFFDGELIKVPFVPPHRMCDGQSLFARLGRIFSHGYLLTGIIPSRICQVSLISMIMGPQNVAEEDILIACFLSYITPWERELSKKGMDGDLLPQQQHALIGLFSRMGMHTVPAQNGTEFKKQLVQMSKSEFMYKPSMALAWMRQGIPDSHYQHVWSQMTANNLVALLDSLNPTIEKVVSSILPEKVEELNSDEDRVMYFLENVVRSFSTEQLERFLLFITGSPTAPLQPIRVAFNRESGLKRAPSASTCGRVLFLSSAYDTLNEFRRELLAVLQSEDAYVMSYL